MERSSSREALVAARHAAGAAALATDNGRYGAYERRTVATKRTHVRRLLDPHAEAHGCFRNLK